MEQYKSIEAFIGATMASEPAFEGVNIQATGMYIKYFVTNVGLTNKMHAAEKQGDYATAAGIARNIAGNVAQIEQNIAALPQSGASATVLELLMIVAYTAAMLIGYFGAIHGSVKAGNKIVEGAVQGKAWTKFPIIKYLHKILPQRIGGKDGLKCVYWGLGGMAFTSIGAMALCEKLGLTVDTSNMSDEDMMNAPDNELNILLNAIRKDLAKAKESALKAASQYDFYLAQKENAASESWALIGSCAAMQYCLESYMDAAMEGVNAQAVGIFKDRLKIIGVLKKELKDLVMRGNYQEASKKAMEISKAFETFGNALDNLDPSVGSAVIVDLAAALAAAAIIAGTIYISTHNPFYKKEEMKRSEPLRQRVLAERPRVQEKAMHDNVIGYDTYRYDLRKYNEAVDYLQGAKNSPYRKGLVNDAALKLNTSKSIVKMNLSNPEVAKKVGDAIAAYEDAAVNEMLNIRGALKKVSQKVGAAVSTTAVGAALLKLGMIKDTAQTPDKELNANSFNLLINAMKSDCEKGKRTYQELSYEYNERAKAPEISV